MDNFDLRKYLKEQKEEDSNRIAKAELILPRGKKVYLQAEEQDYQRGLIVELTKEGGYKLNYWYGPDAKIYPAEVEVDGESIKEDAREVYIKFHPELNEAISLDVLPKNKIAILKGDSGEYEGFIEDGEVSFSTMYDDLDYRITDQYDESNIEDFLGRGHAFVELAKKYDYDWNIEPDLVGITIKLKDKLSESINLSDYNEDVEKAINVGIRVGSNFDVEDVMYYVHNNWMAGNLSAEEAMKKINKYLDPR